MIDQNWNRVLQYPVCTNAEAGTCADTIELAITPGPNSRWEYIPQLRIHRHTIPFMMGDVFQDVLPANVWTKLNEIAGPNMVEFMTYSRNEQFLDAIDWSRYENYNDDDVTGVPFQRIKNAETIAREVENMKARITAREAIEHDPELNKLPSFVTGAKSKSRETV